MGLCALRWRRLEGTPFTIHASKVMNPFTLHLFSGSSGGGGSMYREREMFYFSFLRTTFSSLPVSSCVQGMMEGQTMSHGAS